MYSTWFKSPRPGLYGAVTPFPGPRGVMLRCFNKSDGLPPVDPWTHCANLEPSPCIVRSLFHISSLGLPCQVLPVPKTQKYGTSICSHRQKMQNRNIYICKKNQGDVGRVRHFDHLGFFFSFLFMKKLNSKGGRRGGVTDGETRI